MLSCMKVAYREGQFRDLCTQCHEIAKTACIRCDGPLCEQHTPANGWRCFVCETLYLARETNRVKTVVVALVAIGAVVAVFGALAIHAARNGLIHGPEAELAPLILFSAIALFVAGFALAPPIRALTRRRFLAERAR